MAEIVSHMPAAKPASRPAWIAPVVDGVIMIAIGCAVLVETALIGPVLGPLCVAAFALACTWQKRREARQRERLLREAIRRASRA